MGAYLDPPTGTKEEWLEAQGGELTLEEAIAWDLRTPDSLLLLHVQNPESFSAVGIVLDEREFLRMGPLRPDLRERRYYAARIDDVLEAEPEIWPALTRTQQLGRRRPA